MKNRNWFWGIFFLLSAVAVIAIQIESVGDIGIWSLLVGVLLVALIVYSIINLNFFGIFLPLAFLYMVFWEPLGLVEITPWMLILAAVLTSIGFGLIFHKKRKCKVDVHPSGEAVISEGETIDDNHPYAKVQFGSSSKYLHADALESGRFVSSFGELDVFFDQVQLSPAGAEIFLDCNFGSIKLNIPKNWQVVDDLHVTLGEFTNNRRTASLTENAPRLTITGNVQFGGVEISYI